MGGEGEEVELPLPPFFFPLLHMELNESIVLCDKLWWFLGGTPIIQ